MRKTIAWLMTIVSVAGIIYIIYIFPTLRALDYVALHPNGPNSGPGELLPMRANAGVYFFLIFLFLFGSGAARLREKSSKIFDSVLIILVLLILIPYVLYHTVLRH